MWMAPEQVRILPVSDGFVEYGKKLEAFFKENDIRVTLDIGESLGKRIRNAEKMKIPYMLVVGEKERESGRINARNYFSGEQKEYDLEEFLSMLQEQIREKQIQDKLEKKQS